MHDITFTARHGNTVTERVYSVDDFPYKIVYNKYKETIIKSRSINHPYSAYNIPCTFDIETTNIKNEEEQKLSYAFMYHWQFCIGEYVVFGRYWDEFIGFLRNIISTFHLSDEKKIIIFVQNLAFEWQFMRDFLYNYLTKDIDVFYTEKRKPLSIRTGVGLDFRCSYKLSNKSLDKYTQDSKTIYTKLTGKYNYKKIRLPTTKMTQLEEAYCYCDVRGLADCIKEEITHTGYNITTLPLTSTSFVRRDTLRMFKEYDKYKQGRRCAFDCETIFKILPDYESFTEDYSFREELKASQVSYAVYKQLRDLARGGNTHASILKSGRIQKDVYSFDRVSSYPAVIMTKKFPISRFILYEPESEEELLEYLHDRNKHTIVTLFLEDVEIKEGNTCPYIPLAKCTTHKKTKCDNGRIYKADGIQISVTELDYEIIEKTYNFKIVGWMDCYRAKSGYLPLPLRAVTYQYFMYKCTLKGVDDYNYLKSKNKLNGIFGMTFSQLVHNIIGLDLDGQEWFTKEVNEILALQEYYNSKQSCMRYEWGCYVTAWARWELQQAIDALSSISPDLFIYADTDSVKFNCKTEEQKIAALEWFNKRNKELDEEARKHGAYYNHNGKEYVLGVWEDEGEGYPEYRLFKTYGAKKYAYHYSEQLFTKMKRKNPDIKSDFAITVAGLGKESGAEYFKDIWHFDEGERVPEEQSGRTCSVWNDVGLHYIRVGEENILNGSNVAIIDTTYTLDVTSDYRALFTNGKFLK